MGGDPESESESVAWGQLEGKEVFHREEEQRRATNAEKGQSVYATVRYSIMAMFRHFHYTLYIFIFIFIFVCFATYGYDMHLLYVLSSPSAVRYCSYFISLYFLCFLFVSLLLVIFYCRSNLTSILYIVVVFARSIKISLSRCTSWKSTTSTSSGTRLPSWEKRPKIIFG